MNYWLRGKDLGDAAVGLAGAKVHEWAARLDKRGTVMDPLHGGEADALPQFGRDAPAPGLEDSSQTSLDGARRGADVARQVVPISPQRDEPMSPLRSAFPTPMTTPLQQLQGGSSGYHGLVSPNLMHAISETMMNELPLCTPNELKTSGVGAFKKTVVRKLF
jgi:hypothetical protein